MKTEYKRDLQNNYLILEVPEADMEEDYGLRMAEQNQVKGLLPMHESRQDGKLYLHYEITSKQTLESVYEKKVMGYQDILYVLAGIRDTLEDMRKYLLSPKQLLFAPEMIYVLPKRSGLMLCYYARENEYPITVLAEFILKKLDHKDRQAVTLGYGFFQQASSANFSLPKTLGDILAVSQEAGRAAEARLTRDMAEAQRTGTPGGLWPPGSGDMGGTRLSGSGSADGAWLIGTGNTDGVRLPENGSVGGIRLSENGSVGRIRTDENGSGSGMRLTGNENIGELSRNGNPGNEDHLGGDPVRLSPNGRTIRSTGKRAEETDRGQWDIQDEEESEWSPELKDGFYEEDPPVIHRERRRQNRAEESLTDRVFSKVHPAILLTFLMLIILLELLIAFGVLGLTEAGGCFFLGLSAEILINRRILKKKEAPGEEWQEGEEDEEYQRILREMYQNETKEEPEPIEETRCLIPEEKNEKMVLVYEPHGANEETYPDIYLDEKPLYIGKIKEEADVLLSSPTVSRMHARLTASEGNYFLKDMNSKNGCYVNGRRLLPHEECEIQEGDTVAFAEIEYRVKKRC